MTIATMALLVITMVILVFSPRGQLKSYYIKLRLEQKIEVRLTNSASQK